MPYLEDVTSLLKGHTLQLESSKITSKTVNTIYILIYKFTQKFWPFVSDLKGKIRVLKYAIEPYTSHYSM